VHQHTQAAPASSNSGGSRQGSLARVTWPTPNAMDSVGSRRHGYMNDGRPRSAENPCKETLTGHAGTTLTDAVWATPIVGDSHLASTPEVAQKRLEEEKATLSRQNPGKLNPRWVETLMGLPVGWTMPSCASPVTIALMNSDSSETE